MTKLFISAFSALSLAFWFSTLFMAKANSQTPPNPKLTNNGASSVKTTGGGAPTSPSPQPENSKGGQMPSLPTAKAGGTPPPIGPQGSQNSPESPKSKSNLLAEIIEDYNYNPKDKRDPFQPFEHARIEGGLVGPLWPLQSFDLDQLKLVGIIWDVREPKAMLTDPTGKGYVVKVNERIGRNNGFIARIREGEIVIVESVTGTDGKLSYSTKLIKLQTD